MTHRSSKPFATHNGRSRFIDHVIWDWNGTLLDDLAETHRAFVASVRSIGLPAVGLEQYRRTIVQPIRSFYQGLAERPISNGDWATAQETFHSAYEATSPRLNPDAVATLDAIRSRGITQSLLSMHPHEQVLDLAGRFDVAQYMTLIAGNGTPPSPTKADPLHRHIKDLRTSMNARLIPSSILMVGDTADDHIAAISASANSLSYTEGVQHRERLARTGGWLISSLPQVLVALDK